MAWLVERRRESRFDVSQMPLARLEWWHFDPRRSIRHVSGRFFSVEGLRVNEKGPRGWDQPILHQPDIGILGFLCQRRGGMLMFLVQAKAEPGNVDGIQLSPTLQATSSNYTAAHGGRAPPYLEYFLDARGMRSHVDTLQPEQCSRFFHKWNRNTVVEVPPEHVVPISDRFRWVTLEQLKNAIMCSNSVNAEARSVLACFTSELGSCAESRRERPDRVGADPLPERATPCQPRDPELDTEVLDSLAGGQSALTRHELNDWLSHRGCRGFSLRRCALNDLEDWTIDDWSILHASEKTFSIIGVRASLEDREIDTWDQPIVRSAGRGFTGFLVQRINGTLHALVQHRVEVGAHRILVGPTLQCSAGLGLAHARSANPYWHWFQPHGPGTLRYRTVQSEEGGRFYREENLHVVVDAGDSKIAAEYCFAWVTFRQLKALIHYGVVNSQARSLFAWIVPP
jgi:dTDP-4-dehydro-6-deoxy-alpha-D-glucopyranose 2,3-dehydratase